MIRKTLQRKAILSVIEREDRPLRITEIVTLGRKQVTSLDQATVYRNLNRLIEEGRILRINHPSLGTLFERTGKKHHHHFHCRVCDRLLDLPDCSLNEQRYVPKGFTVDSHELLLSGVCPECHR